MPRFFSLLRRSGAVGNDRGRRGHLLLRGLALLALSTLALGCHLTGPAAVTLPPPGSVAPATLTAGSPRGFYTLYAGYASLPEPEDSNYVWIAKSPMELSALWKERSIPWPMPEVDFDAYVVVALGNSRYLDAEIDSFSLDDRGVLRLKLASLAEMEDHMMTWDEVHVAAIARVALPPRFIVKHDRRKGLIRDSSGQLHDRIDIESIAEVTFTEPGKEPGPDIGALEGPIGTLQATLPLPPEGAVVPSLLDDGTPVWLVHHEGGEVSVLSAFSVHPSLPASDLNTPILLWWDKGMRRFSAWYDERGVPVRGRAWPSLPRYRTEVVSGPACAAEPASRCVRVGDIAPGSPRRHVAPRPRGSRNSHWSGEAPAHASALIYKAGSIREALSRHEGRVVMLDAFLVLEDGKPARVCDVERKHKLDPRTRYDPDVVRCSESAPVVGQTPRKWECDECKDIVTEPLLARVERGHFRDVVSVRGSAYSVHIPGAAEKPREANIRRELGAGVTAAFGGSGLSGGTEVSWGLTATFDEDLVLSATPMRLLVGNVFGFDVRAQLTHRGEGAGVGTNVALGIAGRLNQHHYWARLPSLLGLLAPEVGVLLDPRETTRLYLGASFPFAFRRQNSYFGLELSPTLRYVPETGLFAGVLSLKGLSRW